MLPRIAAATEKSCLVVSEPNTGLNTTQLKTRAERRGDNYIVNGQKVWISTAQVADKMLLLARTTPLEEIKDATNGLSLFYTDYDRKRGHTRETEKMGRKASDSNELLFENFEIPVEGPSDRAGRHDAWRVRLRDGVSRRALSAREFYPAHCANQPAADPEFCRREGSRPAEIVLNQGASNAGALFRGIPGGPGIPPCVQPYGDG